MFQELALCQIFFEFLIEGFLLLLCSIDFILEFFSFSLKTLEPGFIFRILTAQVLYLVFKWSVTAHTHLPGRFSDNTPFIEERCLLFPFLLKLSVTSAAETGILGLDRLQIRFRFCQLIFCLYLLILKRFEHPGKDFITRERLDMLSAKRANLGMLVRKVLTEVLKRFFHAYIHPEKALPCLFKPCLRNVIFVFHLAKVILASFYCFLIVFQLLGKSS